MSKPSSIRVLVVDDEKELRDVIAGLFRAFGFVVDTAHSGGHAWNLCLQNQYQIVISDVRMPDGSGFDLLNNIRSVNVSSPKVFLVTGYSDYSLEEVFAAGADGLFNKPFDSNLLSNTVRKALLSKFDRWNRSSQHEITCQLSTNFSSLAAAEANAHFILGRGGFFYAMPENEELEPGKAVEIDFTFGEGPIQKIKGTGMVRWVRKLTTTIYGYGVEFLTLDENSIKPVCAYVDQIESREITKRTIEFIPAGPEVSS